MKRTRDAAAANTIGEKQLVIGVRHVRDVFPEVGCDFLARASATLEDLNEQVMKWMNEYHLSLFVIWSNWGNRYEERNQLDQSMTLGEAFALESTLGYIFDFGSSTDLQFFVKQVIDNPNTPLDQPIVQRSTAPELPTQKLSTIANTPGAMDVAYPDLSSECRDVAHVVIGQPLKKKNPYITRSSPFYSTIWNQGGEYFSGPAHTGQCRGMDIELAKLNMAKRFLYGYVEGEDEADEDDYDDEEEYVTPNGFRFATTFPRVNAWILKGKHSLEFGIGRPGAFFKAFNGKDIAFSCDKFFYLHPCFSAFEEYLKK
jgi:hypothetical protein